MCVFDFQSFVNYLIYTFLSLSPLKCDRHYTQHTLFLEALMCIYIYIWIPTNRFRVHTSILLLLLMCLFLHYSKLGSLLLSFNVRYVLIKRLIRMRIKNSMCCMLSWSVTRRSNAHFDCAKCSTIHWWMQRNRE